MRTSTIHDVLPRGVLGFRLSLERTMTPRSVDSYPRDDADDLLVVVVVEVEGGKVEGVVQFVASHHGHGSSTIGTVSKIEESTSGPELDFAVSHNKVVEFELHFGAVTAAVDECSLDMFSPCIETLQGGIFYDVEDVVELYSGQTWH